MKNKHKTNLREICERFFIAGVAYHDWQQLKNIPIGAPLDFFWEKENKHDTLAIRIEYDKVHLGYVPRGAIQKLLHRYREAKIAIYPVLVAFNKTNPTYRMLTVKVLANSTLPTYDDTKFGWSGFSIDEIGFEEEF